MLGSCKENAFNVLQLKNISLRAMDACPTMDLLAGLSEEGTIFVFRTMSWDKVVQKAGVEVLGAPATALRFAPHGRLLALGAADGGIAIYDLEKVAYIMAKPFSNTMRVESPVLHLSWGFAALCSSEEWLRTNVWSEAWLHGGLETVSRAGIPQYTDGEGEEIDPSRMSLQNVFHSLHGFILFSITEAGRLGVHAFGLFPLYSVSLNEVSGSSFWALPDWSMRRGNISLFRGNASTIDRAVINRGLFHHYFWLERVGNVILSMHGDIESLLELSSQCARKWKDATKLLPMKLGLLHTALEVWSHVITYFFPFAVTRICSTGIRASV